MLHHHETLSKKITSLGLRGLLGLFPAECGSVEVKIDSNSKLGGGFNPSEKYDRQLG